MVVVRCAILFSRNPQVQYCIDGSGKYPAADGFHMSSRVGNTRY